MGNLTSKPATTDIVLDDTAFVHNDWNVLHGKISGNAITVFSSHLPTSSRKKPFIDRAVQFSRIYRHPSLLKYVDSKVGSNEVSITTERASPLQDYDVASLSALEMIVGLLSILDALIFLHDKAGVSHNNVCPASIYITSDGTWKLWGFEYMSSFGDITRSLFEKVDEYCCQKFIPPDQKTDISPAYQHARDSYAFAQLVLDLFTDEIITDIPGGTDLIDTLQIDYLHKDWTKRPRISVLHDQTAFQHEFLQIKHNVSNILLLSLEEKETFIRSLPDKLKEYSEELVAATLLPALLTRPILDIPGALTHLMPFILIPNKAESGGYFTPQIYQRVLVPLIVQLFSVRDLTVRMTLLKYFYHYVDLVPKHTLRKEILPQLVLGIRDSDESLVASTLIDLASLVPILGADVVVGGNRRTIFSCQQPKKESRAATQKKVPRKEPPRLPVTELPEVSGADAVERAPLPSTRSSPDGGEMTAATCKPVVSGRGAGGGGEWSDWEELMDDQPDIVGSLKVMTPDADDVFDEGGRLAAAGKHDRRSDSASSVSTAMQLRASKPPEKRSSTSTINDFDALTIKVTKKMEPDLFEDLKPTIKSPCYNLERMLIEAKCRSDLSTLPIRPVDALSQIDIGDICGNEWQEEPTWSFDYENT